VQYLQMQEQLDGALMMTVRVLELTRHNTWASQTYVSSNRGWFKVYFVLYVNLYAVIYVVGISLFSKIYNRYLFLWSVVKTSF
jgi:hypothetical protein